MCYVKKGSHNVGTFHVKRHFCMGSRESIRTQFDLREALVYKLLEIIGLGPEVHFLPNQHQSAFGVYIATKDSKC